MIRLLLLLVLLQPGCASIPAAPPHAPKPPFVVVLGIAQDAGYPQAGCAKPCCTAVYENPSRKRHVSCLAVVDPETGERWILDATPDFREQLRMLDEIAPCGDATPGLTGILLTHAHIGHYTGLMFVGHESIGAKDVPVYAMPRMREFLSSSGPWDQLVSYGNIELRELAANVPVRLNRRIAVTPIRVPHREEYSEVVGFRIEGPSRTALFIPDIDKWERWERRIEDELAQVDVAWLDGTFYANGEIPQRDMSQIPHPFITESMARFAPLPAHERAKIRFIHLNHTNPALDPTGEAREEIRRAGCDVAEEGDRADL